MRWPNPGEVIALIACMGIIGCGPTSEDGLAFGDTNTVDDTAAADTPPTTLIAEPPDAQFTAAENDLIAFQGEWVCEFQRRTFTDPADAKDALAEALVNSGIETSAYEDFLDRLAESQDLRSAVLFEYQETCKP